MTRLPAPVKFLLAIGVSFAAGGIGTLATTANIPTWYAALGKPFFNPPNWIFGPVWSVLYLLMGISLALVWTTRVPHLAVIDASKRQAYALFAVQLGLNTSWSLVFFGLHQIGWALVIILALLITIVLTARDFYSISRLAAWLLVPYMIWVSFASVLNVAIAWLNA